MKNEFRNHHFYRDLGKYGAGYQLDSVIGFGSGLADVDSCRMHMGSEFCENHEVTNAVYAMDRSSPFASLWMACGTGLFLGVLVLAMMSIV